MIKIKAAGRTISPTTIQFAGGELHVKLPPINLIRSDEIQIVAQIQSSNDLVELLHVKEILDRVYPDNSKILVLPYLPYGRQDRVTEINTSFTLKTFARLINSLNFNKILTYDAHSDVSLALIDRIYNMTVTELVCHKNSSIRKAIESEIAVDKQITIVAPDTGASKRIIEIPTLLKADAFITLQKHRDVTNGNITIEPVAKQHNGVAVIIDDICDGGATFIQAAKVLREAGFTEVWLYVTHGIFSKGLHPLFEGGIDKIFTTNSFDSQAVRYYYNNATFGNHPDYKDRLIVNDVI